MQEDKDIPCAFLFYNGKAIFFDEDELPMKDLQDKGWSGIHEFHKKYPSAIISIQKGDPIPAVCVPYFLKNIKE